LATQEQAFSKEESFIVQNVLFDKSTKKLIFERLHSKNKKIQGKSNSKLDLSGVSPSRISCIHKATREAIEVSIDDMENGNTNLK